MAIIEEFRSETLLRKFMNCPMIRFDRSSSFRTITNFQLKTFEGSIELFELSNEKSSKFRHASNLSNETVRMFAVARPVRAELPLSMSILEAKFGTSHRSSTREHAKQLGVSLHSGHGASVSLCMIPRVRRWPQSARIPQDAIERASSFPSS